MNPPKIDLSKTALVLIDLQKGITGRPVEPHSGPDVVRKSAQLATRFREAKAPVVLVNVAFSPDFGDVLKQEVDLKFQMGQLPPDWTEIVAELDPQPSDLRVTKRQWGAFHGTELDLQLRRRGVTTIVLGGISTNIGVESTARAAYEHGYSLVLVEDAMASMSGDDHAFAVTKIFPRLGLVRSTEEVLAGCAASK
ncbi:MAG TPA: hydrolase [Candidatus Methylacidiphilales bacterium]|jgi:nicotinamidase-related amidase|nr:hydrolase [Candidatus Methylacidiphilales bacterium]